jgi:cell wall-associated NlpC family hydrolase
MAAPVSDAERFVSACRACVGVRFRHTGRSERGMDCLGLVATGLRAIGRDVDDRTDYSRTPQGNALRRALEAHFGPPVTDPRAGDIALFRWGGSEENHVGVLFDHPQGGLAVVHALMQSRRVIEHRLEPHHLAMIAGVFRP